MVGRPCLYPYRLLFDMRCSISASLLVITAGHILNAIALGISVGSFCILAHLLCFCIFVPLLLVSIQWVFGGLVVFGGVLWLVIVVSIRIFHCLFAQ